DEGAVVDADDQYEDDQGGEDTELLGHAAQRSDPKPRAGPRGRLLYACLRHQARSRAGAASDSASAASSRRSHATPSATSASSAASTQASPSKPASRSSASVSASGITPCPKGTERGPATGSADASGDSQSLRCTRRTAGPSSRAAPATSSPTRSAFAVSKQIP